MNSTSRTAKRPIGHAHGSATGQIPDLLLDAWTEADRALAHDLLEHTNVGTVASPAPPNPVDALTKSPPPPFTTSAARRF